MEVLTREQAISSATLQHIVPEGLTVDEMLAAVRWDNTMRDFTVVMINGHEIDRSVWGRVRPKPGTQLMVAIRPGNFGGGGGSGSGKQILTAVAAIAIMVAAWYVAPMIAGAILPTGLSATTVSAVTAGIAATIGVVGTLALSAFIRPPSLANSAITQNPDSGNAPSENSIYGVSGGANAIARYGVVPKLFGRARMTPNMAAEPYVVSAGPVQTLRLLLDFGYAPLQIEDIRIGTTPIGNFPTARFVVHTWFKEGDALQIYTRDNATLQVGADLAEGIENRRNVPQPGKTVYLDFGFPGGLVQFDRLGNAGNRQETVHIQFRDPNGDGGWNSIGDWPHWALFAGDSGASVSGERMINTQAPDIAQRSTNAITWNMNSGEPPQVGDFVRWLDYESQIVGIAPAAPPPNVEFTIPLDYLTLNDPLPGWIDWNWEGDWAFTPGFQQPQPQIIRKNYSTAVGPITVGFGPAPFEVQFFGRSRAARTISVAVDLPYEANWEFRVWRATPVSADSLISNRISWTALRSEKVSAPIKPRQYRTILEFEVAATEQINGQVQNVNALVTSYLWDWRRGVHVPSRSPALAYAELLTCEANKARIPWSEIDLPKLEKWADWCAANAPQGDIRATCDLVVDSRTTVAEVAQAICAAGRAMPAVINGKYSVLMEDEDRVPVQMFTNRNARAINFSRIWVDEPHALKVRYLSEATWERDELIVYMDGYDQNTATRFETLDLVGTTRPWQAWRMGRYYLAQIRLRKEKADVDADIENLVCQRGDLVRVGHDHLLNSQVARVMKVEGNTLLLDADLDLTGTSGNLVDYDFRLNTMPPGAVFARSSRAFQWNGTAWVEAAIDVPRWSLDADGGLYVEAARTNWVRNPRAQGGVPPALPTNWLSVAARGYTIARVSSGTDATGVDFARIQVSGTGNANAGAEVQVGVEQTTFITAAPSTTYTFSAFMRRVAGDDRQMGLLIHFRTAANVIVQQIKSPPFDVTTTMQRFSLTVTSNSDVTIERVSPIFYVEGGVNLVMDTTFDIGWPQIEIEDLATTPMIPTSGTGTQTPRNADRVTIPFSHAGIPDNGRSRISVLSFAQRRTIGEQTVLSVDGGTNDNSYSIVDLNNSDTMELVINNGGVTIHRSLIGSFDPTKDVEVILELDGQGGAYAEITGGQSVTATGGPASGLNTVRISDQAAGPVRMFGIIKQARILAGTTQADRLGVQLRTANGLILEPAPITSIPSSDRITVEPALAAQAAPGDIVACGQLYTTLTDWLVDEVSPGNDLSARLGLIEYRPEIRYVDQVAIPAYVPPNSVTGNPVNLGPARDIAILQAQGYSGNVSVNIVKVDWDPPTGYQVEEYLVERLFQSDVRTLIARTGDTFFLDTIPTLGIPAGGYPVIYFITPLARRGVRGQVASASGMVFPDTTVPETPRLTSNVLGSSTRLVWTLPAAPDVASFQLRWTADFGNTDWNQMQILLDSVSPATTSAMVHTRSGIYAIRAVDASGNWSDVSYTRTLIEVPTFVDPSYTISGPPWTGTMVNVELNADGHLVLKKDHTGAYFEYGYFEFANSLTLAQIWKLRAETSVDLTAFPDPGVLTVSHDAQVLISFAKDLPKLNSAWFSPLNKAIPLAGDVRNFAEFTPVITEWLEGRIFWTRVALHSKDGIHTPVVKAAINDLYFDPRQEAKSDVPAAGGILEVNYRYPFVQVPSLQITLNNGDRDDFITRTRNDALGFRIEIRTGNGQLVSGRNVDWLATGIGIGG